MSEKIIQEEFFFEGIDCPSCASKVESFLNKEERLIDAEVSFINQKIIIKHREDDDVFSLVLEVIKKVEPNAIIRKNKNENKKMYLNHHHFHHYHHIFEKAKYDYSLLFNIVALIFASWASIFQFIDLFYLVRLVLFIVSYVILSKGLLIKSFKLIKNRDIFNENTLMIIASFGALIIDEGFEAIMIIILYRIGEYYQNKAINHTKKSLESLVDEISDKVTLKNNQVVSVYDCKVSDVMIIKPGEKVLLDGVLISSEGTLDMKSLTGESLPVNIKYQQEVLSGSINMHQVIEVEVKKKYQESTISKVKRLIEEANDKKAKSQILVSKFARVYTPLIIGVSLLVFLLSFFVVKQDITASLNRMFSILVIACPCALVISIPLCYFASIGVSSKKGILVKGSNYLEALTNIDTFIFDKTGTLTKGNFKVVKVVSHSEEILDVVNRIEQHSSHPLSLSIKEYVNKEVKINSKQVFKEYPGKGISLQEGASFYASGNATFMKELGFDIKENEERGTLIHVCKDKDYLGYLVLDDEIKEHSQELITYLKKHHYHTILLSGDHKRSVNYVSSVLELDEAYNSLLPEEKYHHVEKLKKQGKRIAYVGDGINDSPSLNLSDVGISMGGIGADIAKECADIIIMNDDISKIKDVINISKFTKKIMKQNITIILLTKLFAIILSSSGILGSFSLLVSLFADVGICLISILNVLRIFKK